MNYDEHHISKEPEVAYARRIAGFTATEITAEFDRLGRKLAMLETQFPGAASRVLARSLELKGAP